MQRSVFDLWMAMGPFAKGIIMLLSAMSLLSLATALERWFALRTAAGQVDRALPEWRAILAADLPAEARREVYDRTVRRTAARHRRPLRRGPRSDRDGRARRRRSSAWWAR